MNDLYRIMELPPEENETLVGEEWRWRDATYSSGEGKERGAVWRQSNHNLFSRNKRKPAE